MSKRTNKKSRVIDPHAVTVKNPYTLDIVIPVFGAFELLVKAMEAIPESAGDLSYRVMLVDNFSPDQKEADSFYGQYKAIDTVQVFRKKENSGFGDACNFGFTKGRGKYVLFLNSDAEMFPGAIKRLITDLELDNSIGLIGPKLLFPAGTPHGPEDAIQHAGMNFNIRAEVEHTFIGWNKDHPKANVMCQVDCLTGTCLAVRRDIFLKAGGFFTGYGLGTWEDVDLALTIRKLGYNIIYEPKAIGYHWVGGSVTKYNMSYPMQQNRQLFLLRWGHDLPWTIWRRLI